jgi:hypothetical protein
MRASFDLAALQPTDMTNNVSVLPKRAMPMRFDDAEQLSVTASAGDTLSTICWCGMAAPSDEAADIIRALGMANGPLREGKPIDMLLAPDSTNPNRMRPVHVTIQRDDARQISVALAHTGRLRPAVHGRHVRRAAQHTGHPPKPVASARRFSRAFTQPACATTFPRPMIENDGADLRL